MSIFDELLGFDPMQAAERVTGFPVNDPRTILAAAKLHEDNEVLKREEFGLRRDTYHGIGFNDAVDIFHDMGFTDIAVRKTGIGEQWKMFWHEDGVLLTSESYTERNSGFAFLASAPAFYNLRFKEGMKPSTIVSSLDGGRFLDEDKVVWSGWTDFREGARHKFGKLHDAAEFIPQWQDRPWGSLPPAGKGPMKLVQEGKVDRDEVIALFLSNLPSQLRTMVINASRIEDPAYREPEDEASNTGEPDEENDGLDQTS